MATAAVSPAYAQSGESSQSGIWSWLTTVDHKRIGALYMYTVARLVRASAASKR